MNYSVIPTPLFEKLLKRLARKQHSIMADMAELQSSLKQVKQMREGRMEKQSAKEFLAKL